MALDKAIASGKERRRPSRKPHLRAGCEYCLHGRLHAAERQAPLEEPEDGDMAAYDADSKEWKNG